MHKAKLKLHVDGKRTGGRFEATKATCAIEVVWGAGDDGTGTELEITPKDLPKAVVRDVLRLIALNATHWSEQQDN